MFSTVGTDPTPTPNPNQDEKKDTETQYVSQSPTTFMMCVCMYVGTCYCAPMVAMGVTFVASVWLYFRYWRLSILLTIYVGGLTWLVYGQQIAAAVQEIRDEFNEMMDAVADLDADELDKLINMSNLEAENEIKKLMLERQKKMKQGLEGEKNGTIGEVTGIKN